jgi:hypothetical protein
MYKPISRPCDWIILGFGEWYSGPTLMKYYFSFFGFMINVWFTRVETGRREK